jgi:hypothetical protein
MIAQIFGRILVDVLNTESFDHTWVPLQIMQFSKLDSDHWDASYEVFKQVYLAKSPINQKCKCFFFFFFSTSFSLPCFTIVFTYEWYMRVMNVLYLNSIKVQNPSEAGIALYKIARLVVCMACRFFGMTDLVEMIT